MYSWGSDTSSYLGGKSYDYSSAKKDYFDDLGKKAKSLGKRTYDSKSGPDLKIVDPKDKIITTESENPIYFIVDGTGSMQGWPMEIWDRVPLLYQTLSQYKEDAEIAFGVVGDATCDTWPVQSTDFSKEIELETKIKALHGEGGGGGGKRESYELFGYFINENVKAPNAKSPILIIAGDEMFYDKVNPDQVKAYLGGELQSEIDSKEVFKKVAQNWDTYLLHKEYPSNDKEVVDQWEDALGAQRVITLENPQRIVDYAMGLIAKKWGKFSDFKDNMASRQPDSEVYKVEKSLKGIDDFDPEMKSINDGTGKAKSIPLTEK